VQYLYHFTRIKAAIYAILNEKKYFYPLKIDFWKNEFYRFEVEPSQSVMSQNVMLLR